ncbi:MAG: mechanosensitive ion channel family protein [Campylobacterota bacterium]|nr:mechanosensitive ion channel family protein [Campylobacterota bacterium]
MLKVSKGVPIKFFITIFLFIFSLALNADEVKFTKFIDKQLDYTYQMAENNITQETLKDLIKEQELSYSLALDELMANKDRHIKNIKLFNSEIFSLKKIISINKRAGNTYAVLRDEVKIKSYAIIRSQNLMIKNILSALDLPTKGAFKEALNNYITANQLEVQKIDTVSYHEKLNIEANSKTLQKAKENIIEYYAVKDINVDMVNNIYKLESRMYRLNRYSKYHLIHFVVYINSLESVQSVNAVLELYGLTVIKILFIVSLFILIYIFRKFVYVALESYILKVDALDKYSHQILEKLRKPIEIVIIIININMAIYVYNDFSNVEMVSRFFNILYGFFFILMIYKLINTVAKIKLHEIDSDNKKVKNELINVGIKIVNFIILIIGLLIILYFAGVNLTAVLSGLGIGGFAVAFAARDTISNFFGTLSILFSDVFSQGDWIVVEGKEGVVVEIGLRVTTIRTFDNALIAIPNGTFASKDVQNWDRRTLGRRIKMNIGVTYSSKSQDIKNAVSEIRYMLDQHPDIATVNTKYEHTLIQGTKLVSKDDLEGVKKNLLVYLDAFGPSSMNILVYCFTKSVQWDEWLGTKEDVMHNIMEILERNSLEFAFPSMSIYNESESKTQD